MSITFKTHYARDDRMPGIRTLTVYGVITVGNTAINPVLVKSTKIAAGNTLNLDLVLQGGGIGLTVLNDKEVKYTQPSGADITHVNIFHNDTLVLTIDNVQVTH